MPRWLFLRKIEQVSRVDTTWTWSRNLGKASVFDEDQCLKASESSLFFLSITTFGVQPSVWFSLLCCRVLSCFRNTLFHCLETLLFVPVWLQELTAGLQGIR